MDLKDGLSGHMNPAATAANASAPASANATANASAPASSANASTPASTANASTPANSTADASAPANATAADTPAADATAANATADATPSLAQHHKSKKANGNTKDIANNFNDPWVFQNTNPYVERLPYKRTDVAPKVDAYWENSTPARA